MLHPSLRRALASAGLLALLSAPWAHGAIPAGGNLPTPGLGVGSGPTSAFVAGTPATAAAVKLTSGYIDLPNITLNPTGDWAIFVSTISPNTDSLVGTVLSIGTPSDTLFKDAGHLTLSWCGRYSGNPWSSANYAKTFVVTGEDDAGVSISGRNPNPSGNTTFFGVAASGITPLVSHLGFANNKAYGLVIQRRGGMVEFWSVDATGPKLMDSGGATSTFAGITNKPFRLSGAHVITATTPSTNWKQSIQGLVVYNGGALTPIQMHRLYNGASAQSILTLQAARDDRYYPGTFSGGVLTELVSAKHGTVAGAATQVAGILPTTVTDDVILDMDGVGQVIPRDPPPATTTTARFWGSRIGATTDIRMRVVRSGAAIPPAATDIIVDWQTVATGVQNNQIWIGQITGIPHGFVNYDTEISWKVGGVFNAGKRSSRSFCIGTNVSMAGQSILQQARSLGGSNRTFNATVQGFMRAYYEIAQNSAYNMDHTQPQGWQTRPNASTGQWGENRMAERLALLTNGPVGIHNGAVGGSPISGYLGATAERWVKWKHHIQRARPQIIAWGNGQGDLAKSRAERYADLSALLTQIEDAVNTAPGGPWNYQFYIFPLNGNWGTNNPDSLRSYDIEWVKLRQAEGKPVDLLCTALDTTTSDGIHLSTGDAGHGLMAGRIAQTAAHGVGLAPASGNGPIVNRATANWSVSGSVTTINLPVIPNGGTALVTAGGGTPSGWKVKIDGGSYAVPATAQIISPTLIRLTANTAATTSVSVVYLSGGPGPLGGGAATTKAQAGTDNGIYDNRGDMTGLVPGYPMPPICGADPLVIQAGAAPLLEDDFNDGNANGWSGGALWSVVPDSGDNAYKFDFNWTTTSGTSTAGSTSWTNYRVSTEFKILASNSYSNLNLYARYQDASNYYLLTLEEINDGVQRWFLKKKVGGTVSNIGALVGANLALNTWHDVSLEVNGNTLTAFVNGVQILQRTDSSLTSGMIGVGGYKQDILFDNVLVE